MPINCSVTIRPVTKDEFRALDYEVMRHAFASQNAVGRLCDEVIYKNDLAARLVDAGISPVHIESPVQLTCGTFAKKYSADLIVADAALYELKCHDALNGEHEAQTLTYLFLHDCPHGKLVNFRPAQVESRFINNSLTPAERRRFQINLERWLETDAPSRYLRERLIELLNDWGAFLEVSLYVEALTHFLGGEQNVLRPVALSRDGVPLGNQRLHLLTADSAFRLTALTDHLDQYERHLRSLLAHSPLQAIQWINLNLHDITFVTVQK